MVWLLQTHLPSPGKAMHLSGGGESLLHTLNTNFLIRKKSFFRSFFKKKQNNDWVPIKIFFQSSSETNSRFTYSSPQHLSTHTLFYLKMEQNLGVGNYYYYYVHRKKKKQKTRISCGVLIWGWHLNGRFFLFFPL